MNPLCYLRFVSVMLYCFFLVALWSPAGKSLLCIIFSCVFVTFPYGVLAQLWSLIELISDHCLLPYFVLS